MKIAIIGTGYVGLPTGVCFADYGNNVVCIDNDEEKIKSLNNRVCTIYEPGLQNLLERNIDGKRLSFATSIEKVGHSDVYFICVGTPSLPSGEADVSAVWKAAVQIADTITAACIIAIRSTVPVGTTDSVMKMIHERITQKGLQPSDVSVAFVPEFLKQGTAVEDTLSPSRVVIGTQSERARAILGQLFSPLMRNHDRALYMSCRSAEMTKYAANAMLATRISFMNEIANLCDSYGANVEDVRTGIGSDPRIGYSFIYPGIGYGGSCFTKDVSSLIAMAKKKAFDPLLLQAVNDRNSKQKEYLFEKIREEFGYQLRGKQFAVWGLAFKPETDDLRDAPAIMLIEKLLGAGAFVRAYDPVAMKNARSQLPEFWFTSGALTLCNHEFEAIEAADGLCLVTEWKQFRSVDLEQVFANLRTKIIFDGRNQFSQSQAKSCGGKLVSVGIPWEPIETD